MSWLGLRHKGVEILYPEEWNMVVDGLDLLKQYVDGKVGVTDLSNLSSDVKPSEPGRYKVGDVAREWLAFYGYYGYFTGDVFVQGRQVLKDGDPVITKQFIDEAKQDIENIYNLLTSVDEKTNYLLFDATRPTSIFSTTLDVGETPVSLGSVADYVKRLHLKVDWNSPGIVYLGGPDSQDYPLMPGEREVLEVNNPSEVYVRSIGSAKIYIVVER